MNPDLPKNHRILVIDDNRAIHDDFRKILKEQDPVQAAEARMFGKQECISFALDSAYQGEEGLALVQRALAEGRPYAMAFVDVRMPPGWDGLETTRRLWEVYPNLQVVICTAYSDYSWLELSDSVGNVDQLLILKKPFDTIEVMQLARALTKKWWLQQVSNLKLVDLERIVKERTREIDSSRVAALNLMEDAVEARNTTERANEALRGEITQRQRAEETLQRLANIVESSNDAIIGESLGGIVMSWNPAAEKIFGYSAAEMIGRSMTAILPSDRVGEEMSILDRIADGEDIVHLETRRVRKDGVQIDLAATISPIRDGQGKIVGASKIGRDITAEKRQEAKLEETQKLLVASSRQAGMAEFATGVLHNVGNVMNSINVASTCLSDSLKRSKSANLSKVVALLRQHEADLGNFFANDPKGKKVPEYLAQLAELLTAEQTAALGELADLQKNIEHIKTIITLQQGTAKFSHLTEAVKLTELIEETLKMNANGLQRGGIRVIKEFEEIPPLVIDKHMMLQILVNLVRNAMQACEASTAPEKRLTVRVNQEAARVRVAVADTGSGILSENLPRIFAHGFTTKKDGHGFGLHSAALAAKEMGGSLKVQSDGAGCGATFTLELPMNS